MPEAKTYTCKARSLVIEAILTTIFGIPFLLAIIFFITKPAVILLALTIPSILLYFQLYTFKQALQFYLFDKGKTIQISADRLVLTVSQNNSDIIIKADEVDYTAYYEGKSLGKFSNLGYIVIYTLDSRRLVITELTISLLLFDNTLEKFLRKKKRVYFKKSRNFIEEQFLSNIQ